MTLPRTTRRAASELWNKALEWEGRLHEAGAWYYLVDCARVAFERRDADALSKALYDLYCRADDELKSNERILGAFLDKYEKLVPREARSPFHRDNLPSLSPHKQKEYEESLEIEDGPEP